jgi:hypothetical protein
VGRARAGDELSPASQSAQALRDGQPGDIDAARAALKIFHEAPCMKVL